ncbi:uncharacterized protein TNCT_412121, partial [Trichonephila clavata]
RKLEGLRLLQSDTYLPDFYLIPREEEDQYLNYQSKDVVKILPKYDSVPPVIAEIIKKKDSSLKEEPKMEVVYKELSEHLVYKIAENSMKPDYKLKEGGMQQPLIPQALNNRGQEKKGSD